MTPDGLIACIGKFDPKETVGRRADAVTWREVVQPLREPVPNTDREPDPWFGGATYRSKQIRGQREHLVYGGVQPSCNAPSVRAAPLTCGVHASLTRAIFTNPSRESAGRHAQFLSNPYPGSSMASDAVVSTRGGNLDGMSVALSFAPAG